MNFASVTRQILNFPLPLPPPLIPMNPLIALHSKIPKTTSSKSILPIKSTIDTVRKTSKNQNITASLLHPDKLGSDELTSQNNPMNSFNLRFIQFRSEFS